MKKEVKLFAEPEELVNWLGDKDNLINLSMEEAQILLNYMEGHDYAIGIQDDQMIRKDLSEENGEIEDYTITDVINAVCQWNYELILDADEKRHNPKDFMEFTREQNRYESLKKEESCLDRLFVQTVYGKEIEKLATKLAGEFFGKAIQSDKVEKQFVEVVQNVHRKNTDKRGR